MRCWYTRWQISNAIDRGDLEARLARGHAARCAACRTFARSLASLHDRLERELGASGGPPPVPVVPAPRPRWPLLAGGAAAAAAVIAVIAIARPGFEGAESGGTSIGSASAPAPELAPDPPRSARGVTEPGADPDPAGPQARWEMTAARVSRAFASTSLEAELRAVLDDGARGVRVVLSSSGLRRRL